ncbi:hypothetical protein A7982_12653 [Minicystis rosea]|nr:hypothetical protein A7982_12653 [Minicystis rosea]
MGKFPQNPSLTGYQKKMGEITSTLDKTNQAYEASLLTIVQTRVDVKFADYFSDTEIKQLLRRAALTDGKAGGPLFKAIAPEGQSPLIRPFGQKQVDVLIDIEGTLRALAATWPAAAQEEAVVKGLRTSYEVALKSRADAWQNARNLRAARNLAKLAFVKGYTEVSLGVKALFLDDKNIIELLFDEVESDIEKDLGEEEEPENPQGPTPA